MLTGIHLAFVGGDLRQLEVIRKCIEMDANVDLIGYDNLDSGIPGSTKIELLEDTFKKYDAIILPVSGVDQNGHVDSIFSSGQIHLSEEHFSHVKKTCTIYSGISSQFLNQMTEKYGIPLVLLMDRDDIAIYNSIPTVEGTLMLAIQNTDITIHRSNSLVLGLGRVGMSLARALGALGARVSVAVRKPEDMARVYEMGFEPLHINDLKHHVSNVDYLFNTIPHKVVTAEVLANLKPTALIIDLASKPGGCDFRYAEKRGIKAILAPGLPGIVAPKTAGQIIANTIIRLLLEKKGNQEG
jgi:dipicolinate synthase subunit A